MATENLNYQPLTALQRFEILLKVVPAALGTVTLIFLALVAVVTFLISSVIGDFWQSLRVGIIVATILIVGVVMVLIFIAQEIRHRQDVKEMNIALGQVMGSTVAESVKSLPAAINGQYRQISEPALAQLSAPRRGPSGMWLMAEPELDTDENEDGTIKIPQVNGKIIELPFPYVDDFFRMEHPQREKWPHDANRWAEVGQALCGMKNAKVVEYRPQRYSWNGDHANVLKWWNDAVLQAESES